MVQWKTISSPAFARLRDAKYGSMTHADVANTATDFTVQYRVVFAKNDEAVDGPDDASVIITVPAGEATKDPTSLYMCGVLKAAGSTGALFAVLRSGAASATLARLASRP